MKGIILGFDESKEEGKIRGSDENRYRFVKRDFNADQLPEPGTEIDFEIEDSMAKDIYVVQKFTAQSGNSQGMQANAANVVGNISSNEDFIKAKGAMIAGFDNAPVAIVALLIYAVATFLPLFSTYGGWFSFHTPLFETGIGKVTFILAVLLLVMIVSDIFKAKRTLKILGALALMVLPWLAMGHDHHYLHLLKSSTHPDVGLYLLMISALVLLFSPIKKQGAET
ncbi:MAG: hypothetical protein Q9M11_03475 [Mariprofundaceae bacterium]|nr:hypothetical protein [Mariprofundaceae bacterium]